MADKQPASGGHSQQQQDSAPWQPWRMYQTRGLSLCVLLLLFTAATWALLVRDCLLLMRTMECLFQSFAGQATFGHGDTISPVERMLVCTAFCTGIVTRPCLSLCATPHVEVEVYPRHGCTSNSCDTLMKTPAACTSQAQLLQKGEAVRCCVEAEVCVLWLPGNHVPAVPPPRHPPQLIQAYAPYGTAAGNLSDRTLTPDLSAMFDKGFLKSPRAAARSPRVKRKSPAAGSTKVHLACQHDSFFMSLPPGIHYTQIVIQAVQ